MGLGLKGLGFRVSGGSGDFRLSHQCNMDVLVHDMSYQTYGPCTAGLYAPQQERPYSKLLSQAAKATSSLHFTSKHIPASVVY